MFTGRARKRVRVRGLVSVIVKVMFRVRLKLVLGPFLVLG
jgi:hypothetical protein